MQNRSPPSLSPRKPRNAPARPLSPSPSRKQLRTPPTTAKRRRTGIAKIADLAKRRVTFSKRRGGLFKKANALCKLTGARAAIIVFSTTGKRYSFGNPKVEDIISDYLRRNSELILLKGLREWVDWIEKKRDSCATEDFDSLIVKCETILGCVRKKLKDLDNNPSVKAGAGGDSGVGVGPDCEVLYDEDEIYWLLESFEAPCPSLLALFEEFTGDGDCCGLLTSPVNSAPADGSLEANSTPTYSDLEGCGFDPEIFLNLSEDFVRDGFLSLPENSAIGARSLGEDPTRSHLEGYGYDPEDFIALENLDVCLVI